MHKPTSSYKVVIGWGVLIAALLACSTGGQAPSGGGAAPTEAPVATEAPADTSSPLDTLDPCTIVTIDDASAYFGVTSAPPLSSPGAPVATCVYATPDNVQHLSFSLRYAAEGGVNYSDYTQLKPLNQDVPGLGDGAFFDVAIGQMTIAKGNWIVKLSGNVNGGLATIELLTPIAQAALGRLP